MSRPQAQTHGATECRLVYLWHEDDEWVLCSFVEFRGCGIGDVTNVTSKFDDGDLHS